MNFLEKIDRLMQERGLNRRQLAEKSGVPYTTIVHFYTNGYENTKLSTLQRLCEFFNVPLDYLVKDDLPSIKEMTESLYQPDPLDQEIMDLLATFDTEEKKSLVQFLQRFSKHGAD